MGYLTAGNRNAGAAAEHLEQYGYVLVPGVLSESEVAALASEINHVFATQPPDERSDRSEEANAMFRYGMLNHSALCQDMVAHRGILDVIEPLLGEDCHVIANTAWRNPPNSIGMHGGEAWHIDAGPHVPLAEGVTWPADIPHPTFAVGVHIYLRECTLQDGPTGVLAGSHLSGRFPPSDRRLDDDLTYNEQAVIPLLVHYGRRDIAQRISTTDDTNHLSSDAAPSGSNAQGWQFMFVTDADKRARIGELYAQAFNLYREMPIAIHNLHKESADTALKSSQDRSTSSAEYLAENMGKAPVLLIPCIAGRTDQTAGAGNLGNASTYGSIIPAAWSFMLAARARGLGTAWTTLHLMHEKEIADLLGIPFDDYMQVALIPLAYTKGTEFKPAYRPPLDTVMHIDQW
ncbi:unnamed protein product [Symbiodinium pilosum]|uniref:Nitroreductase domain-containing protein n=1 Tax=Symbiodinium pilosum TaxID=2952 RepID=A0A812IYT6_SYMPI|nr:unnamed protein product [Symbiodinium pilosum]